MRVLGESFGEDTAGILEAQALVARDRSRHHRAPLSHRVENHSRSTAHALE
jgi:hypothetical protein